MRKPDDVSLWHYLRPLFPLMLAGAAIAMVPELRGLFVANLALQAAWFIVAAHIPAARTRIMSFVDLAWPWGLCIIGLVAMIGGEGEPAARLLVGLVYGCMGMRTGMRSLRALRRGAFRQEFSRYQYQRLRWSQAGKADFDRARHVDIAAQWLLNATLLAAPAFVLAQHRGELIGTGFLVALGVWMIGFAIETLADRQKRHFLDQVGARRAVAVCDIGLWSLCRHPNYFGEWLVWTGLSAAALALLLPGALAAPTIAALLLAVALLYVPRYMFIGLTRLTGVEPAEYYSRIRRAGYSEYCKRVPAFWPRLPRVGGQDF